MLSQKLPPARNVRDVDAEYLKAVEDTIARRKAAGKEPTPFLLQEKALLEAKIAAKHPSERPAAPEHRPGPISEHKAAEPPAEAAVPRKPGRPRKADVDRASGN